MILFYTKIVVLSIQMKAIAKIIYDGERKWERAETGDWRERLTRTAVRLERR